MKLPLTSEEFEYIYSKVPRLNVEILIKTPNGLVLTKRSIEPWRNYWHIPGGTVWMHETLEDAVVRIARYETGLRVKVGKLLGSITYPSITDQGEAKWPVGIAFLAEVEAGELQVNQDGEEIAEFSTLPELMIKEQSDFISEYGLL